MSYSAPSSARQGDAITVNVKIVYLKDYAFGPLHLTSVSVGLRSDPDWGDIVSSKDSSPPSLKVGSEYSRDFELNLTDYPEKPGKYYVALVWAIREASWGWDTGREDPTGVRRQMSFELLPGIDTDGDGLFDPVEVRILATDPRNPDTDGDGLNDGEEVNTYRTNPLAKDTDRDGLPDGDEVQEHGTNPLEKDTDRDGLNDGEETSVYQTNPLKPDTDGDGLSDGDEVNVHRTEPLANDTDGDDLSDGEEVQKYGTNPLEKDTDRDGLDDASELARGTNPKAQDTDGDGLNDGDEITKYRTDPLKADTDADGLSDGDEIKRGTSPIRADTDGDSWNDSVDIAPLNPLIPNILAIVAVIAVLVVAALAAWRVLGRRRKTATSPTVKSVVPSLVPPPSLLRLVAFARYWNPRIAPCIRARNHVSLGQKATLAGISAPQEAQNLPGGGSICLGASDPASLV
jgi:hypothetical protein